MEDQLVTITTYVNPHIFWILFEKDRKKLFELEKALLKHKYSTIETQLLKELVAINDNKLWKRALILNYEKETCKFDCWLIDYGETLVTDKIYELPKYFKTQSPFVQPASLYNIVSLKNLFSIEKSKPTYVKQLHFNPGTIKVVRDYLKKANSITFHLHKVINNIFCGTLLLTIEGSSIDLNDELVKKKHVDFDTDLFLQALKENLPLIDCYLPCTNSVNLVLDSAESSDDYSVTRGRGYNRNMKKDLQLPGTSKVPSVTKWLVHNKIKNENTSSLRLPSKFSQVSINEKLSKKSNSNTSSEMDSNESSENNEKRTYTNQSKENDCSKFEDSVHDMVGIHSSTKLSNGSFQDDQELDTSLQSNKSRESGISNLSDVSFDLKSWIKGRGKSKLSPSKDLTPNKTALNVSHNSDVLSANSTETGQSLSSKYDDSWEDVEETDSHSQSTTDCSYNKSSFEDSCDDPSWKIKSTISSPHSDTSRKKDEFKYTKSETEDCDKNSSSSVINSSGNDNEIQRISIRAKLKLGCQCENCYKWDENDFAEKEPSFPELRQPKKIACKPPPLFKNESSTVGVVDMKTVESRETKIQKDIAPSLLVHSLHIPCFASGVADVAFSNPIHTALNHLNIKIAYTIQSYAWPAIMRLMNTCLIGSPNSGKTMAYLPAICSFVIEKEGRFSDLPKESSPLAIVLCESMSKVEEVYNFFVSVLKHTREKVKISFALPPLERTYLKLVKSSDILIVTPKMLIYMLSSRIINLKRLCHLVVENADKILSKHGNEFDLITKGVQSMLDHRVCFYGVQIITISETWTPKLEIFLKKLDNEPIICISNYLQCAIYAQASIKMHFVKSSLERIRICGIVKENSGSSKTVIVCNEDSEVLDIGKLLQIEGASVTIVTSNMMAEEIGEQEELWCSTLPGRHSVLVCTDVTLNTQLSITQAEILIHYSLPQEHWTIFSKRFKCLLDNYESPLNSKFQPGRSFVHVFVNDNCSKQYPRLCDFLTKMGTKLSEKFQNLCKIIMRNEEQNKIQTDTILCKKLKLLGHCNAFRCRKRHMFSDTLDLLNWIPTSGRIKFKLLNVQDATVFGVRLLEHMDTKRNVRKMADHTEFLTSDLKQDVNNTIYPIKISTGELYAWYEVEKDTYHRCKVLRILNEFRITRNASEVLIRLIDGGKEKKVLTENLFNLPKKFRKLPPQSVDVYLANILPLDEDEQWCMRTKSKILNIMEHASSNNENSYFAGRIVLQIGDSLWLDDIQQHEDLEYSNETVTLLSLKKKMLDLQMCNYKEQQLSDLYKHCEDCGINLPNYVIDAPSGPKKVTQVSPQWAFLDEGYNVVHFSSAESPTKFYVRQQKFNKLFLQLQSEIQEMIKKPFYPEVEEVKVDHCYLAQDPEGDEYGRVIVKRIEDEMIDCFFIDFGDSVKVLKSELKHLPDDYITRLPCQAIECSLYGVQPVLDNWAYEATDVLYDHYIDPDSNTVKNLYIHYLKCERSTYKGRNIYSVVLLSYVAQKQVFINKLLIDCGFAANVKYEDLNSVDLPEIKREDEIDEDVNIDDEEIIVRPVDKGEDDSSDISEGSDIWDVCINDSETFFKETLGKGVNNNVESDNHASTPISHEMKPMKALPSVNFCTPDVRWYQTEQLIKLDILLADVEEYNVLILRKNIFSFSTFRNNKEYKLNFQLFNNVSSTFQHIGGGPLVRVTLTKEKCVEWDRLTSSDKKMRNIKYDTSKWVFPEDNQKRLFLDIGKDDPEEIDDDAILIEIGSDVDYSESDIESDFERD